MKNATKAEEQARVTAVIAKLKARLAAIHEQIEAAHRETSRIERAYGERAAVAVADGAAMVMAASGYGSS